MPSFESPLGNKRVAGPVMREIDVPDESDFNQENIVNPVVRRRAQMPDLDEASIQNFQAKLQGIERSPAELEQEFVTARKAKLSGKERLGDSAKRRIEMLLNMTKTTHSVDIEGNVFVLQTIPSKYMEEAIMSISRFDGTVQAPFEARRQFLARSIVSIAGVDFNQFVGSNNFDVKLEFIDEIDESLLNRLYSEYLFMAEKAKDRYSVKNEADAREVMEDLKK